MQMLSDPNAKQCYCLAMLRNVHQHVANYMVDYEAIRANGTILGHKCNKNDDKILEAALILAQPKNN